MSERFEFDTPSLLITDDDPAFRETLQRVLEPVGYRTLLATDGEQALEIVRTQQVHVALLDMHMPKLTGLELLPILHQFKSLMPCILISADADEVLCREARRAHAYSVLSKPVSRRKIREVVAQALRLAYNWP